MNSGQLGIAFTLGHGHYAQFMNFQECLPEERKNQIRFINLRYDPTNAPLNRIPFFPKSQKMNQNLLGNLSQDLAGMPGVNKLFLAGAPIHAVYPIIRRIPSYMYLDFTHSLMKDLSPWYDELLGHNEFVNTLRIEMYRVLLRACKGVFTMSRWSAEGVQKDYHVPPTKIHVVQPGANLKRWHYVDRSARSSQAPVRILMVGGEFARKGGFELLDWAENTKLQNWEMDIVCWPGQLPAWVLEILGRPGPDDRISCPLAPRLPQVRINCGMRANTPELMNLYAQADIFCLPTHADGSTIAPLEAMATGLPVLEGAVGGIPELIQDGVTGYLLHPGNPLDLKNKLEKLILDRELRLNIGNAGRKSCEDFFNTERQIKEIFTIIDQEN